MSDYKSPPGRVVQLPIRPEAAAELKIGEIVYITGSVFTLLDKAFWRIFEEGVPPPLPMHRLNAVIFGGGKITQTADGWIPDSLTPIPTTGARYYRWVPALVEQLGIRALISKEGMGDDLTIRGICSTYGAVALAAYSFPPKLLPDTCKAVELREWEDLGGVEALTVYTVDGYGPLVVNIDTSGNCLAEQVSRTIHENAKRVYARHGLTPPASV